MKKTILLPIMLFAVIVLTAQENQKEIIKETIQTSYVEGLQNEGDASKIDAGFHPGFYLLGIDKEDAMWKYSIKDWKNKAVQKRKEGVFPLVGNNKVSVKFLNVDITGNAAMVKLEYYIGEKLTFVDYISLYKFESGWKIVSKIFYKY